MDGELAIIAGGHRLTWIGRWLRQGWVVPTAIFLGVFSVYALTACRAYTHIDAQAATVESWRIASAGEPWLDKVMTDKLRENKFISQAPNGHVVGQRMAGPVIAGIPFYWLLDNDPARGAFTLGPGGIAAAACTAGAVLLVFLTLRRHAPPSLSLIASLVFALATPTWSVSANMLWTHPVTQLGIAGAAYAASRGRWWVAGMFLAIGMLGRPHVALIAAVLGLGVTLSRRSLRPAIQVALPTLCALGFLEVWNRWMFGVWSVGGAYAGRAESAVTGFHGNAEWSGPFAQAVNYLGFLFSFDRGFFVWTPIALVLLPALVRSWRRLPDWSKWLALGGVVYTFFQLRIEYFPGGDGFYGYRYGLELLTCLVPAYAFSLVGVGRIARLLAVPVIGIQAAAIGLGAISERFFVSIDDVWTDNSLWLALRHYPGLVSAWLIGGVVVCALVAKMLSGQPSRRPVGRPQVPSIDPS